MTEEKRKTEAERVRASLNRACPGLLAFLDAGRDRLGVRLTYLETPDLALGKRPGWFDDEPAPETRTTRNAPRR